MAIKIIYIKGYFRGKYSGSIDNLSTGTPPSYPMEFYESHIEEAETIDEYNTRYLTFKPFIEREKLTNTTIQFKGINKNNLFQEDLTNVLINNVRISNIIKSGYKSYGNVEGDIYASFEYWEPEKKTDSSTDETIDSIDNQLDNDDLGYDTNINNFTAPKPKPLADNNKKPTITDSILPGIKESNKNFGVMFITLAILWWLINKFGFNWFTVSCIGLYLAAFIRNILAPILGWNKVETSNTQVGCNVIIGLLLIALAIVCFFTGFKQFTWILLVLFILSFLKELIGILMMIFGLLCLLLLGIIIFSTLSVFFPNPLKTDNRETTVPPIEVKDSTGKTKQVNYTLKWKDYENNVYNGSYSMLKTNFENSLSNRNKIEESNDFGTIYNTLWKNDQLLLPSLYKMLDSIKTIKHLNQQQFADVAVSFVQYIPYVLVHDETCSEIVNNNPNNEFIQTYHREGKECLSKIKFGVQAPAEFSYNIKGDCDTRAMVLFTILDHFHYDVAMLVSGVYGHCILGVNMPGTGTYKSQFGKRYYVWETTARDFRLGQLPPENQQYEQLGNCFNL